MSNSNLDKPDRDNIVDFIADILDRRGADSYLGEEVTVSEHMLQAAQLAESAGADDEIVAAALLHDIGHFTNEFPEDALANNINNYHDGAGAAVLDPYFPERVSECVRQHVAAKRYLCAVDPNYFETLSPASVHTLKLQGGPMNVDEVATFEKNRYLKDIIRVRKWDEQGKVKGRKVPSFEHYAPLLRRVIGA